MSLLSLERSSTILSKRISSIKNSSQIVKRNRSQFFCKASFDQETESKEAESIPTPQPTQTPKLVEGLSIPEWMPEQGVSAISFLTATDFDLKSSKIYKEKLSQYLEKEIFQNSIGFKPLPESIHGRLAMIGVVTGVLAEIFGAGSMLYQFGKFPLPVLLFSGLITAASIIPIVKGTEGEYMDSLKDQYTVPEGVFTEANERLHGRLAMLGISVIFFVEALSNSALF